MARELTRDEILAAVDLKTELVPVPEWGEDAHVRVRAFSLEARAGYTAPALGLTGDERAEKINSFSNARLVAFSLVDPDGSLIFAEGDVERLAKKNPAVIDRIAAAAARVNGIGQAEESAAAKN